MSEPGVSLEPIDGFAVRIHEPGGTLGDDYERSMVVDVTGCGHAVGKILSGPLTASQARALLRKLAESFDTFEWERRRDGKHRRTGMIDLRKWRGNKP